MIRQAMMAVVGCGLIACANGTETSTSQSASPQSTTPAPEAPTSDNRLPDDTVVAKWEGGKLTYGELVDKNSADFRKFRNKQKTEMVNFERQRLEATVVQRLVQAAAKEKGQSEEEFLKAETGDVEVTDEEVKKFYESDPRIKSQPFDKIKSRIKSFLSQQKSQKAMVDVFERLKKEADMKVDLPKPDLEKVEFELAGRPSKGKDDAKVTIVEFSDFECPYCSRAVGEVEKLVEAYPDEVKVVFMHYPLPMHSNAMPAAVAAQCANEQDKFWPYHDAVFANQRALGSDKLEEYAKTAGLDVEKFKKCVDDPKTAAFVKEDMEQGSRAGVEGTPSFFINGEPHQGVPSVDDVKPYLEG